MTLPRATVGPGPAEGKSVTILGPVEDFPVFSNYWGCDEPGKWTVVLFDDSHEAMALSTHRLIPDELFKPPTDSDYETLWPSSPWPARAFLLLVACGIIFLILVRLDVL